MPKTPRFPKVGWKGVAPKPLGIDLSGGDPEVRRQLEEIEDAIRPGQRAKREAYNRAYARMIEGIWALDAGDMDGAIVHFEASAAEGTDAPSRSQLYTCYRYLYQVAEQGADWPEVIRCLERIRRLADESAFARWDRNDYTRRNGTPATYRGRDFPLVSDAIALERAYTKVGDGAAAERVTLVIIRDFPDSAAARRRKVTQILGG